MREKVSFCAKAFFFLSLCFIKPKTRVTLGNVADFNIFRLPPLAVKTQLYLKDVVHVSLPRPCPPPRLVLTLQVGAQPEAPASVSLLISPLKLTSSLNRSIIIKERLDLTSTFCSICRGSTSCWIVTDSWLFFFKYGALLRHNLPSPGPCGRVCTDGVTKVCRESENLFFYQLIFHVLSVSEHLEHYHSHRPAVDWTIMVRSGQYYLFKHDFCSDVNKINKRSNV